MGRVCLALRCAGLGRSGRRAAFRLLLQAQRGHFVRVGAVLGFHLVLDAEDGVVEFPLHGQRGVAGGGEGVVGVEFGFEAGLQFVVQFGDGAEGVGGVGGLVAGDDLEGQIGVHIGLQDLRGDAGALCVCHVFSKGY